MSDEFLLFQIWWKSIFSIQISHQNQATLFNGTFPNSFFFILVYLIYTINIIEMLNEITNLCRKQLIC